MSELWKRGATEIATGIRGGDFKPSEVMSSVLSRVQAMNPTLNAITFDLSDQAMEQAIAADDALAGSFGGSSPDLPPLFGVPLTIKENVDMAGLPTPNGVAAFANVIASEDAPLVRNLTEAGAIVIGRTNTPEFSMRATTDNPLRGRTINPWDPDCSPGGSSGGAGSACASGMGTLHHGNDIGGSLRFPAFANGVTTIKPTTCRVPVFNSSATAERGPLAQAMSVQGIIARHAADVGAAMQVMIRPDHRDPNCPPVPWHGPDIGRPKVAFTTESAGYDIHPELVAMVRSAAAMLADAGYEVLEVDPPPVQDAAKEWFRAGTTEMQVTMDAALREHGSETINRIFDWYYELSEILDRDSYIGAMAARTKFLRDWNLFLAEHPLLITPFLMRPTYDWNYDAESFQNVEDLFNSAIYSTGINYLGLPGGVIGMDLVAGRPAAVQIVGQRYREDLICEALAAIEAANGVLIDRLWNADDAS